MQKTDKSFVTLVKNLKQYLMNSDTCLYWDWRFDVFHLLFSSSFDHGSKLLDGNGHRLQKIDEFLIVDPISEKKKKLV
jgi:hypothetical protein